MKKFIFVILALLLMCGVANATNIPQMTDPKNYPTVWTELVYNGSGSTITSAYVVQWDFASCDSDAGTVFDYQGMWVTKANAADDIWTAGVSTFGQDIPNGTVGRIIIKGPAVVYNAHSAPTVNTIVSATANGYVGAATGGADNCVLGVVIAASAANADIGGDATVDHSIVWVDPTLGE